MVDQSRTGIVDKFLTSELLFLPTSAGECLDSIWNWWYAIHMLCSVQAYNIDTSASACSRILIENVLEIKKIQ